MATGLGKKWKKIVGAIVLVMVVLALITLLMLDSIIKTSVEKVGSFVTKCDVTVEDVNLSLLRGELKIVNFKVGNPEGYKTDSMMSIGRIYVAMDRNSVLTDTIRVRTVEIAEPAFTVEVGLGHTNVGTVLANVNRLAPAKGGEPKPEPAEDGKKVVIDRVLANGGKVSVSATILGGKALPILLPTVELHDIGKEKDGASMSEAVAVILKGMLQGVLNVANKAMGSVTDAAGAVSGAVSGGVTDAAGAVSGAVSGGVIDAAGAASEGASEAAKKLSDGVKGIFKR